MKKILLIIEQSKDGILWGRVEFNDNLMIDSAKSLEALQNKMKKLLHNFHDIDPSSVKFDLAFDLTVLFVQKDYLNVSAVASKAGINPTLMRQYVAGFKYPSLERAKAIEQVIREIGRELVDVKVAVAKNETAIKSKNSKHKAGAKKKARVAA